MRFAGEVRIPEVDHPGVPAVIVVDEDHVELELDGESLGRWSAFDVHAARLVSSAFAISLGTDEITFIAKEPTEFAYEGVEHMAEVWARLKAMSLPRRTLAVKKSRRGSMPSRISELRAAMEENLQDISSRRPAFLDTPVYEDAPAPALRSVPPPNQPQPTFEPVVEPTPIEKAAKADDIEPHVTEPAAPPAVSRAPMRPGPGLFAVKNSNKDVEGDFPAVEEPAAEDQAIVEEGTVEVPVVEEVSPREVSVEEVSVEEVPVPGPVAEEAPIAEPIADQDIAPARQLAEPDEVEESVVEEPAAEEIEAPAPVDEPFVEEDESPAAIEEPVFEEPIAEPIVEEVEPEAEGLETLEPAAAEAISPESVVVDLDALDDDGDAQDLGGPAPVDLEPALAGVAPAGRSGLLGAVRAAFIRNRAPHEHEFVKAPGGIGIHRQICSECGYVSIGTSD